MRWPQIQAGAADTFYGTLGSIQGWLYWCDEDRAHLRGLWHHVRESIQAISHRSTPRARFTTPVFRSDWCPRNTYSPPGIRDASTEIDREGYARPWDKPGLGIEVDWDWVNQHTVRVEEISGVQNTEQVRMVGQRTAMGALYCPPAIQPKGWCWCWDKKCARFSRIRTAWRAGALNDQRWLFPASGFQSGSKRVLIVMKNNGFDSIAGFAELEELVRATEAALKRWTPWRALRKKGARDQSTRLRFPRSRLHVDSKQILTEDKTWKRELGQARSRGDGVGVRRDGMRHLNAPDARAC